jgi:hypothetical protein
MNLANNVVQSLSRTLLSNATACQLLANIATMQFYYQANGFAFSHYYDDIWQREQVWTIPSIR